MLSADEQSLQVYGESDIKQWGFKIIYLFINFYLFLAALGLRFWAGFSLAVASRGYSLAVVREFLIAMISLVEEHGSRCKVAIDVALGLSCSEPCGIFPGQGLNLCSISTLTTGPPGKSTVVY